MGFIHAITTPDLQTFPAAVFKQAGSVPEAQCQESTLNVLGLTIVNGSPLMTKAANFAAVDLQGKEVVVTNSTTDDGTYNIISNTDDAVLTDHNFTTSEALPNGAFGDVAQAYLTRDLNSFGHFIHAEGGAYTIKGGVLYTDMVNFDLEPACSDTWNPGP